MDEREAWAQNDMANYFGSINSQYPEIYVSSEESFDGPAEESFMQELTDREMANTIEN